jgi:RNA polymerase subunit RPABC4/transcription elongation factor Spt4
LTRGQKMCKSCSAIIGTASRVCNRCGAQCPKGALKKT